MKKPIVFVIIPFEDSFKELYSALKKHFEESFDFTNAGDLDNQQNILQDIVVGIHSADVIIADLTGLNPNVFYELGLAHAMGRKVIIITQNIDELPFDIKAYRANPYSMLFYETTKLFAKLEELLSAAIDGSKKFGNPVSDFIKTHEIPIQKANEDPLALNDSAIFIEESDDCKHEDKGFLDFIADIEESMIAIVNEIDAMTENLNGMSGKVSSAIEEISRVNSTGDTSAASFVRNVSRKLSLPVDAFASQLKIHVTVISDNWNRVENNYLDMLDDKHIQEESNLQSIHKNIEALEKTKAAVRNTDEKFEGAIGNMKSCMGVERRLTKAITLLISEFQNYLSMTGTIVSSIDRIIAKSKVILDID
ncbi:MAG: nucleoside 2-deoxyribosyltransferase [Lachnospiraceae bacterium]|jgi:archaellum component FlaC|nr:nucleoside 2-deoxyribosyltransferase [Lachnospiraceae bacterium]